MTPEAAARATYLKHLTAWPFAEGRWKRLGVAVSGGSDSMALLELMAGHGADKGLTVEVVTVDHGLRPEARDEAAGVAERCKALNLHHEIIAWEGWDGAGNLQAEARAARYRLIAAWARRRKISRIALGHTRDDVAETFLMRLGRAAGVDGLAQMERRFERHGLVWLRPMLQLPRDEARKFLVDQGLGWADDPSNDDPRFDRVRARQILRALDPLGIEAETLARTSRHLSAAKSALDHYTRHEALRLARLDRGDLILTRGALPPVPIEIERRLLVAGILWVSGAVYPPRFSALAEMETALVDAETHTLGGCLITRNDGAEPGIETLRIAREWNAVKAIVTRTDAVWDGRWMLEGPHDPNLRIRALGQAVALCPDWRGTGMPRASLMASPSIWRDEDLIAAPLAGFGQGWTAKLTQDRDDFAASLL